MKPLVVILSVLLLSGAARCTTETSLPTTKDNSKVEIPTTEEPKVETTITEKPKIETTTVQNLKTPTGPTITDVCGLSLISPSEEGSAKHRRCRCSELDLEVDCSYLDATQLPKLISFPKSARFVKFIGNKIENIANDTFYAGRFVLELDLSHNHIDFVSTVAFRPFKSLRVLDLSHNKLWNIPMRSFDGLTDLRSLDLAYNDIVSLSTHLFSSTPNLLKLDLESNPLEELDPKQFENLKKLESLSLKSTLLRVIPDHLFVFTPSLKMLELSNNQLDEVPTDALKFLDSLKYLDLSGNSISSIKSEAFQGMRGLVLLYLNRLQLLTKIEKYAFGDLQLLQELHCSYNFFLSDIDGKAFVKKTTNEKVRLSQLFLKQNALNSLPEELLDWDDTLELHIADNPIYCDCNMDWMVHLKLKNNFQKHTKCYGPSHLQNTPISDLKDSELSCGLEATEIVMIILASGVGFLLLSLIIAFLVWRRSYSGYSRPYFRVSKKKNVEDIDYRGDDGI